MTRSNRDLRPHVTYAFEISTEKGIIWEWFVKDLGQFFTMHAPCTVSKACTERDHFKEGGGASFFWGGGGHIYFKKIGNNVYFSERCMTYFESGTL